MLDLDKQDHEAENIDAGFNRMLDAMGIYQHHDAVSGTGKQAVAEDYSRILAMATSVNNVAYGEAVRHFVNESTGLDSSDWQQCYKMNSTYLDCPINDYNLSTNENMTIAIHNPSAIDRSGI